MVHFTLRLARRHSKQAPCFLWGLAMLADSMAHLHQGFVVCSMNLTRQSKSHPFLDGVEH